MNSRVAEITRCETAAGCPGRCMPVVLLLAALVVVITSVWIVIDGLGYVAPDTPRSAPLVAATEVFPGSIAIEGKAPVTPAANATTPAYQTVSAAATLLGSESKRPATETGFGGHLRD